MTPQEEQEMYEQQMYMQNMQQQMDSERTNMIQREQNNSHNTTGIMKEQLDLNPELDLIEHLLKGEESFYNEEKQKLEWKKPDNNDIRVLSDLGIQLVMNTLHFYLNKNTLLSNYNEDQINSKMEDFSESLNDVLFMSYEKYFLQPTRQEIQDEIKQKITNLTRDKIFYLELKGFPFDEKEIQLKIIKEMDLEREMAKIRQTFLKEKLKGFEHLLRKIQDTVHSAYQRAWNGQERRSLRQHMTISESIMPKPTSSSGGGLRKLFG